MPEVLYKKFTPENNLSMQRQITMFLRHAINTGKLKSGDKIPPSRKLAQAWDTNYFTVNSALKPLVQEGILLQKPRLGTIVKKTIPKLARVGIYLATGNNYEQEDFFYSTLVNKLQGKLAKHDAQVMIFRDSRPENEMNSVMNELQEAVHNGKIDCLIAPLVNKIAMKWLATISIPRVAFSSIHTAFSVCDDTENECQQVIERFKELNVKTVGIISCIGGEYNSDGSPNFVTVFKKMVRQQGLECKDQWCINPENQLTKLMRYGYEAFKKLYSLSEKPEGLLIHPDVVAMGAINSIMENRVKIPEEMKLIIHQNVQHEIFTPFKADRLVSDPEKIAQLLMDKLENDTIKSQEMKCAIYKNELIRKY